MTLYYFHVVMSVYIYSPLIFYVHINVKWVCVHAFSLLTQKYLFKIHVTFSLFLTACYNEFLTPRISVEIYVH